MRQRIAQLEAENADLKARDSSEQDRVPRIVITGGPCAGKSTAMNVLRERLEDRNVRVFVAPEAATLLFTAGVKFLDFAALGDDKIVQFQVGIARLQIALEDLLQTLARHSGCRAVLLCDRGVLDGRAYCSSQSWGLVMEELGQSTTMLRDRRYDAVLHLTSAAKGAETFYNLIQQEGAGARTEDIAEARNVDARTQAAWTGHARHIVIENPPGKSFEDKLERVVNRALDILGFEVEGAAVRKFVLSHRSVHEVAEAAKAAGVGPVQLFEATTIHVSDRAQLRTRVPHGRSQGAHWSAYRGHTGVWSETILSGREYLRRAESALAAGAYRMDKDVCVFMYGTTVFTVNVFKQPEPIIIVEVRSESASEEIKLPPFLVGSSVPVREVTGNPDFDAAMRVQRAAEHSGE